MGLEMDVMLFFVMLFVFEDLVKVFLVSVEMGDYNFYVDVYFVEVCKGLNLVNVICNWFFEL